MSFTRPDTPNNQAQGANISLNGDSTAPSFSYQDEFSTPTTFADPVSEVYQLEAFVRPAVIRKLELDAMMVASDRTADLLSPLTSAESLTRLIVYQKTLVFELLWLMGATLVRLCGIQLHQHSASIYRHELCRDLRRCCVLKLGWVQRICNIVRRSHLHTFAEELQSEAEHFQTRYQWDIFLNEDEIARAQSYVVDGQEVEQR